MVEGGFSGRGPWGERRREIREVLPTPWEPRRTSLASRGFGVGEMGVVVVEAKVGREVV